MTGSRDDSFYKFGSKILSRGQQGRLAEESASPLTPWPPLAESYHALVEKVGMCSMLTTGEFRTRNSQDKGIYQHMADTGQHQCSQV